MVNILIIHCPNAMYHIYYAANIILHVRHNFLNTSYPRHAFSFALRTVNFFNKPDQTEKLFYPEKGTSRGDHNEWILRSGVSPVKRYGRFAPLRVEKENSTLSRKLPYAIFFKLDISIWMKWVNDSESIVA
jgi:hypothetical protein